MTLIATGSEPIRSDSRHIMRSDFGKMYVVYPFGGGSGFQAAISSDDGATWDIIGIDSEALEDRALASMMDCRMGDQSPFNDNFIDVIAPESANPDQVSRFEFRGDGSSSNVRAPDDIDVQPLNQNKPTLARLSNGQRWSVTTNVEKIKGVQYKHYGVNERNSDDDWTRWVTTGSGEANFDNATCAVDNNDNIHICIEDVTNGQVEYGEFDPANLSFVVEEEVITTGSITGAITVDSGDIPIIPIGQDVWKRTGGTWSSDQFTTDAVDSTTVVFDSVTTGETWVPYDTADLKENHNTFGSFATGDAATVVSGGGDELEEPSSRWQQYKNNSPSPNVIDVIYFNQTQGEYHYEGIQTVDIISAPVTTIQVDNPAPTLDAQGTATIDAPETVISVDTPSPDFAFVLSAEVTEIDVSTPEPTLQTVTRVVPKSVSQFRESPPERFVSEPKNEESPTEEHKSVSDFDEDQDQLYISIARFIEGVSGELDFVSEPDEDENR